MRAVVYDEYGPPEVLRLAEVPTPVPGDDDVRIRVRAVSVNTGDCEMRRREIPNLIWLIVRLAFGLRRPRKRILGAYFAGEVESVGANVTRLAPGQRVFAATGARFGAYAEYVRLPHDASIAAMPEGLSFEEAAGIPLGGTNALHYIREAKLRDGERMLVMGAGGAFGTFAVQLGKLGGAHVTAVDRGVKLDLLRELGADRVVDFEREDVTAGGERWDVIFNMVASYPFRKAIRALNPGGRYLLTNPGGMAQLLRARLIPLRGGRSVVTRFAAETTDDLDALRGLVESGGLRSPVDRSWPLEQAAEAHRYVETDRKLGNVVLTVD